MGEPTVTIGDRLAEIANLHPNSTQVQVVDASGRTVESATTGQLQERALHFEEVLRRADVTSSTILANSLSTEIDFLAATIGAWRIGATVLPVNPRQPERDRVEIARNPHIARIDEIGVSPSASTMELDEGTCVPSQPRAATLTGGSTGVPKIVLHDRPWVFPRSVLSPIPNREGLRTGQVQLVVLPLHHAGFTTALFGLAMDHSLVFLRGFSGRSFFSTIEEFQVNYVRIVPFYMKLALDTADASDWDLRSLEVLNHGAAPCPMAVKRAWMDLVGPERVIEDYAAMERIGSARAITTIRGDEWLLHPGSVGRARDCTVSILDETGTKVEPGVVGRVFVDAPGRATPRYLDEDLRLTSVGSALSVGDMGYLDSDGYLYLVGRESNVINSGGVKIFPAEVEQVLLARNDIADARVEGVKHEYLGYAVKALLVSRFPDSPTPEQIVDQYCRENLPMSKVPMFYEYVSSVGRTEAGKLKS